MGKRKHKNISSNLDKSAVKEENNEVILEPVISSDEPPIKQVNVIDQIKAKIAFFCSIAETHDMTSTPYCFKIVNDYSMQVYIVYIKETAMRYKGIWEPVHSSYCIDPLDLLHAQCIALIHAKVTWISYQYT
jgi:hypothetical protein